MKQAAASRIVSDALKYFDGERYELGCYVVMPDHVHAVIRPLAPRENPLETILQSRKLRTARAINALVGRSGTLWQEESFDRIIRDEEHLYRCIQYIGRNPRMAGLVGENWRRWIHPTWEELGWRFED